METGFYVLRIESGGAGSSSNPSSHLMPSRYNKHNAVRKMAAANSWTDGNWGLVVHIVLGGAGSSSNPSSHLTMSFYNSAGPTLLYTKALCNTLAT
jgi:hypothetical protein